MKLRNSISRSMTLLLFAAMTGCEQPGSGNEDMGSSMDMAIQSRFGLLRATGTTTGSSAIAVFLDQQQQDAGCLRRAASECVLYACAGTGFVLPHPGSISIGSGGQVVRLEPRADGSYTPYSNTSTISFPPGQQLTIDAPGQVVPPLHAELTPPNQPFNLTNPDGTRVNIVFDLNRQQDFQLSWMPLPQGTRVHAELNQDTETNRGLILECDFDGARGQGTLPVALLRDFQLTSGVAHVGNLIIGPSEGTQVSAAGWDVGVFAMSNARAGFANIVQ